MKVLFIGGTGVISTSCSDLCIERGIELYHLNRGTSIRKAPEGVKTIRADIRDIEAVRRAISNQKFDAIVNWIAFTPDHVKSDFQLFKDITNQYIFISSASAYQKPVVKIPITEETPLYNPNWAYSQAKIDCENYLMKIYKDEKFPVTIVRPSHTYDKTRTPFKGDYTFLNRLKTGKKILIHDDGNSLWTMTHAKDFAKGLVGLLGNKKAIGEAFHITSDEHLTWNQIAQIFANKLNVELKMAHIPAEFIAEHDEELGVGITWDKRHPGVFDNTKIKNFVPDYKAIIPFEQGASEVIDWYESNPDQQIVEYELDNLLDRIIDNYESNKKSSTL